MRRAENKASGKHSCIDKNKIENGKMRLRKNVCYRSLVCYSKRIHIHEKQSYEWKICFCRKKSLLSVFCAVLPPEHRNIFLKAFPYMLYCRIRTYRRYNQKKRGRTHKDEMHGVFVSSEDK
ncbi:MAG: hypothetical protein E7441_06430 [Ruminococcaceae bacterium]|nr:hypothetical protein [Oscillospiraceae bacterium]